MQERKRPDFSDVWAGNALRDVVESRQAKAAAPMFQIVNVGRDTINIAQIGRDELAALLASRDGKAPG